MPTHHTRNHQPQHEADPIEPTDPRRSLALFRKRLAAGNYDAIIGLGQRRTLRLAAEDTGLEAEVGYLRLILHRLINEETDLARLAANASRLLGVAGQYARLRAAPDGDLDEIRTLLLHELDAFDREQEQERNNASQSRKECLHGVC